jgi:ketosteroid isomerase-like protein
MIEADVEAKATLLAVDEFNEAFNRHDVDAVMHHMTDDCVFESTGPAPDGGRFVGQDAVRHVWEDLFGSSPSAHFDAEEMIATRDRCVVRWLYSFEGGHIRGVDVIRVRDGKVAEKFAYVKG